MPSDGRGEFRLAIATMLQSWLWELQNHIQHRIPDPVDYVEMRRKTFGSDLTMSLARLRQGERLSRDLYQTRPMRALDNSASDFVCLLNDIFSYQKEIEFEGELNNMVLVVQQFLDVDKQHAVAVVNDLMTARIRQFQHTADVELPILADDFDLSDDARQALRSYVEELEDWMSGIHRWHASVDRYREPELRRKSFSSGGLQPLARRSSVTRGAATPPEPPSPGWVLRGPTGVGTSAARIGSLLAASEAM